MKAAMYLNSADFDRVVNVSADISRCWEDKATFDNCCDVVHWGPGGNASCWEARPGGFERCCVGAVLEGCAPGCSIGGTPLLAGVSSRMCQERWEMRVCDFGQGSPEVAVYSQWSTSYLMTLAFMLRSLRLAGDAVRLVLRRVWDTRNVTTGSQFNWGPSGYERQRGVRARWFESIVRANWHRRALISDTDVEFFPGWLATMFRCLGSSVDLCAGQQPGFDKERRDQLNPGFVALRGNLRTQLLFKSLLRYRNLEGIQRSEVFTFNYAIKMHPPAKGGPSWAVFHPEVVVTGIQGMEIRILRIRIHHAATGHVPHRVKMKAVQRLRRLQFRLRGYCTLLGAGRFPAHPVCFLGGEFPRSAGRVTEDSRLGRVFDADDLQGAILQHKGVAARWNGDAPFQALLTEAQVATGLTFPDLRCTGVGGLTCLA